jgi:hypothetical protein
MSANRHITIDLDSDGIPTLRTPRRRWIRRAKSQAMVAVACVSCGLMLMPAIAGATVDNTASQWADLGPLAYTGGQSTQVPAVYTLQNLGEAGDLLLEDHGNQMRNEAPVDVWDQTNQATGQDPDNSNLPSPSRTSCGSSFRSPVTRRLDHKRLRRADQSSVWPVLT